MTLQTAIALTRFGFGPRPGELQRIGARGSDWLLSQIRAGGAPNPDTASPSTAERLQDLVEYGQVRAAARRSAEATRTDPAAQDRANADLAARRAGRRDLAEESAGYFLQRARFAASTDSGFAERWAMFWSNVFAIAIDDFRVGAMADQYERDAIRPHVFGRFSDLARAAEQHPAMLYYLNQAQSVGPNSARGRRRDRGLNENLAREAMELHTVGADAGYGQADVTEFAKALTGWGVEPSDPQAPPSPTGFSFNARAHEPGVRRVLGKTYPDNGQSQGEAILADLSDHPATRRRLSTRLAAHFVGDAPPPSLVQTLERAWEQSRGDLAAVARALILAPEAWAPVPAKVKPPYDLIISTHRAFGAPPNSLQSLRRALQTFAQPLWRPPSPRGWPDGAADWAGPDALVARLNWSSRMAAAFDRDPVATAQQALGERLSARTLQYISRAESRPEGLTLFLMSPEFQRR